MGKELTCSRCGDKFNEENGRRAGKMNYCGYCEAVVFGDKEEITWPPKIRKDEYRELKKFRPGTYITNKP